MKTKFIQHIQCLFFKQASGGHCLHFQNIVKYFHISLKVGLYDEIFLSRPWNFYFERKMSKYFRKRNVCGEIQFVQTIKFHSYDHNNVLFIERIMLLAIGGKAQTKTQFYFTVTFQRFSKTFQWMRNVYQR